MKNNIYKNYTLVKYQINLYSLFIELSNNLLKNNSVLSFIVPNNWLTINTNKDLREFILKKSNIVLVNFYAKVFESASVDSSIIIYTKSDQKKIISLYEYEKTFQLIKKCETQYFLNQKDCIINIDILKNDNIANLILKIENKSANLKDIADVKVGLKVYQIGKGKPRQTKEIKEKRAFHSTIRIDETYFKYLEGQDVCRYILKWSGEYLKYGEHLAEPRKNFDLFSTKRILVRQIPSEPPYCINACLIEDIRLNDLNSMNIINIKLSPEYF